MNSLLKPQKLWYRLHSSKSCLTNLSNEIKTASKIARLSIEQSTENLRLNTDYYKAGTCTMSDLLDAQTLYQQSCDKYVESYTDYELKKREYLQVTGRR